MLAVALDDMTEQSLTVVRGQLHASTWAKPSSWSGSAMACSIASRTRSQSGRHQRGGQGETGVCSGPPQKVPASFSMTATGSGNFFAVDRRAWAIVSASE